MLFGRGMGMEIKYTLKKTTSVQITSPTWANIFPAGVGHDYEVVLDGLVPMVKLSHILCNEKKTPSKPNA